MSISMISAASVKAHLAQHQEIALIDVREHGEYGERHPFHSVNIPFSRFEVDLPRFVPRADVLLVLFDEAEEGRALACAQAARSLGYSHVQVLTGGAQGWAAAGYTLFAGVNVPSKTFGEMVEHHFHTPSISAETLADWQRQGRSMTVLDGRTEQEYHQRAIPQAKSCPNGELALRAQAMIADPEAPVVIHCAGRTRSLVGAETLRHLAPSLNVYALENGTQGWELAGFNVAEGLTDHYPEHIAATAEQETAAQQWAERLGVAALSIESVQTWLAQSTQTTYVFDVRTASEMQVRPFAGAIHAPGGQLLQATDLWVGVRFSRIILISDDGCRAPVVGAWLTMMGFTVGWYQGTYEAWQSANPLASVHRPKAAAAALNRIAEDEHLSAQVQLLDARTSSEFQRGHYVGSRWINRSSLTAAFDHIASERPVAIVAASADLAELVAEPLRAAGFQVLGWLPLTQAHAHLSVTASADEPPHHERIDYLYFVHDRHMGNLEAAKQYLAWELGLIDQLDAEEQATYRLPPIETH